ncbi:Uncharacterized protein Y057_780 [Fusarium fujikuroi]|nr:Uncharacterized protein Y057_780 [Fusarium fujikuroi]
MDGTETGVVATRTFKLFAGQAATREAVKVTLAKMPSKAVGAYRERWAEKKIQKASSEPQVTNEGRHRSWKAAMYLRPGYAMHGQGMDLELYCMDGTVLPVQADQEPRGQFRSSEVENQRHPMTRGSVTTCRKHQLEMMERVVKSLKHHLLPREAGGRKPGVEENHDRMMYRDRDSPKRTV